MKEVKSVAEIIDFELKDAGLGKAVELWSIYKVFRNTFEKEIAGSMEILSLKQGILKIRVPTSVWVQELSFFEGKLIDKINVSLGNSCVKHIKFTEV